MTKINYKRLLTKRKGNAWILLEMAKKAGRSGEKNLVRDYKYYLFCLNETL